MNKLKKIKFILSYTALAIIINMILIVALKDVQEYVLVQIAISMVGGIISVIAAFKYHKKFGFKHIKFKLK